MKHSNTWFALILILSVSLPNVVNLASAESKQQRGVQHKAQTQPTQEKVQNQQPQVIFIPSSELDSVVAALRESDDAVEQQAIAAQKQAEANQQNFCSPAVVINEVLAAIGFGYLIFMGLQWKAIDRQAKLANETLIETRKAANAASDSVAQTKEMVEISARQATAAEAQVTNLEQTLIATQKAASAAVKNADAALAASAAYLDITSFWLETDKKGSDVMDSGVGVVDPFLHWTLTNHGRSPAIVTELCWQKFFGLRLPDSPIYDNVSRLPRELVIGAENEDQQAHQWSLLFGTYLTEDDMGPVRRLESRLQIYGYVRYRDVFDRRFIIGYAFRLDAKGNPGLVTEEEAAIYLYRRIDE